MCQYSPFAQHRLDCPQQSNSRKGLFEKSDAFAQSVVNDKFALWFIRTSYISNINGLGRCASPELNATFFRSHGTLHPRSRPESYDIFDSSNYPRNAGVVRLASSLGMDLALSENLFR